MKNGNEISGHQGGGGGVSGVLKKTEFELIRLKRKIEKLIIFISDIRTF